MSSWSASFIASADRLPKKQSLWGRPAIQADRSLVVSILALPDFLAPAAGSFCLQDEILVDCQYQTIRYDYVPIGYAYLKIIYVFCSYLDNLPIICSPGNFLTCSRETSGRYGGYCLKCIHNILICYCDVTTKRIIRLLLPVSYLSSLPGKISLAV